MHKLYSALIWRQIGQAQSLLPANDWDCIQFCMIIQYNTLFQIERGRTVDLSTQISKRKFSKM